MKGGRAEIQAVGAAALGLAAAVLQPPLSLVPGAALSVAAAAPAWRARGARKKPSTTVREDCARGAWTAGGRDRPTDGGSRTDSPPPPLARPPALIPPGGAAGG